jgi:hypothetical protein
MIDPKVLEVWLNSANTRYRVDEVPLRKRPFKALSDFSCEFNCPVATDSLVAQVISEWFYAHSQPGSHAIGPLFTGAFYFDTCFWPMHIPIGASDISVNALDSLKTMPEVLKEQLSQSRQDFHRLIFYWVDCCDYASGMDDINKQGNFSTKALAFAQNGHKELVGAISQLTLQRPNVKAILALRMASEIFLKALLIQERSLTTDQQLKQLSHRIEDIAHELRGNKCPGVRGCEKGCRRISQSIGAL